MSDAIPNEAESIQLAKKAEVFWHALGLLTAKVLGAAPKEFTPMLLAMLQDKCSVYGADYEVHLRSWAWPTRQGWAPTDRCGAKTDDNMNNWRCKRCGLDWPTYCRVPTTCKERT